MGHAEIPRRAEKIDSECGFVAEEAKAEVSPGFPRTGQALAALGLTPDQLSPGDRAYYDHTKAHDDRIAAILEANGGEVICPRCKRPTMGWPLKRRDICSEKDAVFCMRDPEAALADIARRVARNGATGRGRMA